ncbi:hypothetical protein [Acidocella facilis]|uniref:hypothetical protein n=1 Tax=Acidocella facilis TaxID=525 RepID=UPI001F25C17B|nr:hypothetical protein [Acidocella facilis]
MADDGIAKSRKWTVNQIAELRKEAAEHEEKGLILLAKDCRDEADALERLLTARDQQ